MTLLELIIACAILLILHRRHCPSRSSRLSGLKKVIYTATCAKCGTPSTAIRTRRTGIRSARSLEARGIRRTCKRWSKVYNWALPTIRKFVFSEKFRWIPMTGTADWGLRSVQDDPDSTSWGGKNVFDVYSKSTGTAQDGTKYSDW